MSRMATFLVTYVGFSSDVYPQLKQMPPRWKYEAVSADAAVGHVKRHIKVACNKYPVPKAAIHKVVSCRVRKYTSYCL